MVQETTEESDSHVDHSALPAVGHALAGAIGASVSNVCTYPLALIVTRLQVLRKQQAQPEKPRGSQLAQLFDTIYRIVHEEGGVAALYNGIWSDTSKTIADAFLFFLAYDYMRRRRRRSSNLTSGHTSALEELGIGFVAGAFAKFFTMPLANIVTRKQTSPTLNQADPSHSGQRLSSKAIALEILDTKGVRGFWSGYSASLVLTLNPSLTFLFHENLKHLLVPRARRSTMSPSEIFFLAAISKAIASTMTYPFSLAKSRLQTISIDTSGKSPYPEVDSKAKPQRQVQSANLFSMIRSIYKSNGLQALYRGLEFEVLKGFLSHGMTIMVKDTIQKFAVRLIYAILTFIKK